MVDAAATVTGARYVNLSWLQPDGWIRGSVWTFTDSGLIGRAMTQARFIMPGFDPAAVRFRSDVNPAVRRVLIDGRPTFGPFTEHVEGTVPPLIAGLAQTVLGLQWTHSVPLVVSGAVAGTLAFHWHERPHPRSLGVAEAFSAHAALTLENARLLEALRARATDIERSRERIATAAQVTRREIAETLDHVASRILVATQRLLGCRELLGSAPDHARAEMVRVAEDLDRLRDDDVRAASHRLHPSLISVGLVPALEILSESFAGIDVSVTTAPGVSAVDNIARNALPPGLRLAVYRFVEDAVGGIATASEARSARIEVAIDRGSVRTTVIDETGRALGAVPPATMRAIRDRMERVGGTIEIGGDSGRGHLTAVVPLPSTPRPAAVATAATALFQRIVDNALGVTGARMVSLSWYDVAAGMHELGAFAPFGSLAPMVEVARRSVPGFDPGRIRFPVDVNPLVHGVFVEGRALLAPTAEHAAGTMPSAVLRVATTMLGIRWTYSVPLRLDGRVTGALAFHFEERPADAARRVADVFASQAELTLANERLSADLRERAVELAGSRERIAATEERVRREVAELLHGRVQSRVLVVAHRLVEACGAVASDPAGVGDTLARLARDLDAIRDVDLQRAIRQLHPAVIGLGLMAALRELADELGPRLDVAVAADPELEALDGPTHRGLPEATRLGVYRAVEEALANVVRHSGASAAAVHVGLATAGIRITVSDAGRGFDPAKARTGIGLRAMRDHIESLGGQVEIEAAPGRGTRVTLALPVGWDR